jgi:uncharacterized protein
MKLSGTDLFADAATLARQSRIFNYTLVKLAMRCNLNCAYCYWFRDESVYERPPVLTQAAEDAYLGRLRKHIERYALKNFFILFHGGEPLLFGKKRFASLCGRLRRLEEELGIELKLGMTSNGVLIDAEWASLFKRYKVQITLSIDGPQSVHDATRVDFSGRGTLEKTVNSLRLLRGAGINPGVLAVCHPQSDVLQTWEYFTRDLTLQSFDILIPDANHDATPASIAAYYKQLFDLWYDRYALEGVEIRLMESIAKGLLGAFSRSESIGYGPTSTSTLLTDGSLEPLDVLRTAGYGFTRTKYSVFDNDLQDVENDPLYQEVLNASLVLAPECQACEYKFACGGGHIASRWSSRSRFNNPSVYCADFKEIFAHAWRRMANDLFIEAADGPVRLSAVAGNDQEERQCAESSH